MQPKDKASLMQTDANAPIFNPLPWIVWALVLPLVAIEVLVSLGTGGLAGGPEAIGWRIEAIQRLAFAPQQLREGWQTGLWQAETFRRMLTYPLVHLDFGHALFAVAMLLALGKWVGEVFRWWAVLMVVAGASVAGAFAYTLVPDLQGALIGAYPAVYGLIGAFTFTLWVRLSGTGRLQVQAFSLIGLLMLFQLVFGAIFGGGWFWLADLAGFGAGFLLSFVVSPGGWSRVGARLRQR